MFQAGRRSAIFQEPYMKNKIFSLVVLALSIITLSSCMLFFSQNEEPRYEIAGNWRRTAGEWNATITYYLKADGTYSYSNNQNGDLDSGEYTVDWTNHTINTNHKTNHSLDKSLSFSFRGPDTLVIDFYEYSRQ